MRKVVPSKPVAPLSILRSWWSLLRCVVSPGRSASLLSSQEIDKHLLEAVRWLLTAREHNLDAGISAHFDLLRDRWAPSYSETTGYAVPTLLACAHTIGQAQLRDIALELADWLLRVRTSEGGVGHWGTKDSANARPVVFDTGQVIFGWLAAWQESGNRTYLEAAETAGRWLLEVQDVSGAWIRYQHQDTVKVIDTRVALALVRLAGATGQEAYTETARRNLNWAMGQQQPNGWFQHSSFLPNEDPFTHTIAYTAEGLLESGILLGEEQYIEAAQEVADVMLRLQRVDGSLASTYNEKWSATSRSSCLTGNCQMALIWTRLYELSGDHAYLDGARRAIAFVAGTQNLRTRNPSVRGAIAGSWPIYGHYQRFTYPNWAAKFFIDALLALESALEG